MSDTVTTNNTVRTVRDAEAAIEAIDHVADLDTSHIEQLPAAGDLLSDIKTTVRVVAALTVTVARVAGLDVRSVVDDDLPSRLGRHVPALEG